MGLYTVPLGSGQGYFTFTHSSRAFCDGNPFLGDWSQKLFPYDCRVSVLDGDEYDCVTTYFG